MRAFAGFALLSMLAGAVVVACVGDDPDGGAPQGATPDAATPADGSSPTDGAVATDTGSTDTGADAGEVKRVVFVTSAQVSADFAKAAADPWAAADEVCGDEAKGNGLAGTFVAWLSYKKTTDFNAASRITDAPYYLAVNPAEAGAPVLVVESRAELLSTGPRVPIDKLPNGQLVPQDENSAVAWVWTGSNAAGNATGYDCDAWTTLAADGGFDPSATLGDARKYAVPGPTDWTTLNTRACDASYAYRFYCFQK